MHDLLPMLVTVGTAALTMFAAISLGQLPLDHKDDVVNETKYDERDLTPRYEG